MGTHSLDKVVLEALEERGSIETFGFSKELGKDHQSVVGSVKSIHALGDVSENVNVFYSCWSFGNPEYSFRDRVRSKVQIGKKFLFNSTLILIERL